MSERKYNTPMPDAPRKDTHHPMDKPLQNIQDSFLNHVRKERIVVQLMLVGGTKLSGRIKSFDKYAIILESNSQEQLIFKHAISTVAASRPGSSASPAAEA
jgi:host factor-I protein